MRSAAVPLPSFIVPHRCLAVASLVPPALVPPKSSFSEPVRSPRFTIHPFAPPRFGAQELFADDKRGAGAAPAPAAPGTGTPAPDGAAGQPTTTTATNNAAGAAADTTPTSRGGGGGRGVIVYDDAALAKLLDRGELRRRAGGDGDGATGGAGAAAAAGEEDDEEEDLLYGAFKVRNALFSLPFRRVVFLGGPIDMSGLTGRGTLSALDLSRQ